ncbi:MAG: diaminopimelate decarboxylase family protein, partial [Planctomycetota bacterium]
MDAFQYRDGALWCEGLSVRAIAERYGTPAYIYSRRSLLDHYGRLAESFGPLQPSICFSVKSCSNLHILRLLHERGAWFDVVSGGELRRVLEAGVPADHIVFAGVGKTDEELRRGLEAGIAWFNVESEQELGSLIRLATELGKTARVALRINPDVDPHTHVYTTTGKRETKFGVDLERARAAFERYGRSQSVEMCGLHLHLGSPVGSTQPYVRAITKALETMDHLRRSGHTIRAINIGGGFAASHEGGEALSAADYAAAIVPLLQDAGLSVLLEPGRSIAANAGVLLTRTIYVKQSGDR